MPILRWHFCHIALLGTTLVSKDGDVRLQGISSHVGVMVNQQADRLIMAVWTPFCHSKGCVDVSASLQTFGPSSELLLVPCTLLDCLILRFFYGLSLPTWCSVYDSMLCQCVLFFVVFLCPFLLSFLFEFLAIFQVFLNFFIVFLFSLQFPGSLHNRV